MSSSTPTTPFYALDHPPPEDHNRTVTSRFNSDAFEKRGLYADDATVPVPDFSYGTKDLRLRSIDSDSNKLFSLADGAINVGSDDQNTKLLDALWSNDFSRAELDFGSHIENLH
jgi:hypothetical protein